MNFHYIIGLPLAGAGIALYAFSYWLSANKWRKRIKTVSLILLVAASLYGIRGCMWEHHLKERMDRVPG